MNVVINGRNFELEVSRVHNTRYNWRVHNQGATLHEGNSTTFLEAIRVAESTWRVAQAKN